MDSEKQKLLEEQQALLNEILHERKRAAELERRRRYLATEQMQLKNPFELYREPSPYLKLNSTLYENAYEAAKALFIREFGEQYSADGASAASAPIPAMDVDYRVPEHCVPIRADVRQFDWQALADASYFDVILMDPPWQLASANPTRGVTIAYKSLHDREIEDMKIDLLQKERGGFLFVWVINAKFTKTLSMISKWGYRYIDDIAWVKSTVRRRVAKGHGHFLYHAKEHCIVAMKGTPEYNKNIRLSDVIFSERRGQSQKPEELYTLIESLVPNGKYLEIFARKNNLRDYWVSIGNEL